MKMRLFLFDLDGTLVSTGGAGGRAIAKTFLALYNLRDASTLINMAGKTDLAIFREIMKRGLKRDMTNEELVRSGQLYLHHLEQEIKISTVVALPGAMEFVKKTATCRDVIAGLGTGNLEKGARLKLEPAGFNPYFSFGGFGSDAEDRAEMLRAGHRRGEETSGQKIDPSRVIVIGDTPLDVFAARRNKYKVAAVATGRTTFEQLQATKPDYVFKNLSEADELLGSSKSLERT
jgi:phosphoglycolate phosphatase-like HAD superfamily hydrolase